MHSLVAHIWQIRSCRMILPHASLGLLLGIRLNCPNFALKLATFILRKLITFLQKSHPLILSKFCIENWPNLFKEIDHFLVEKVIPYFVVCSQHVNIPFLGIMPQILLYESVCAKFSCGCVIQAYSPVEKRHHINSNNYPSSWTSFLLFKSIPVENDSLFNLP